MKVFVKSKGEVVLNDSNFVYAGGEGQIYRSGNIAYKIYLPQKKVIPVQKIQELSSIKEKNVIIPKEFILDRKNKPIGYTMRYIPKPSSYSLCEIFTKAFKDRNKISTDIIVDLVQKMRETINHVHLCDILIVDLNELNFLINKKFDEIYFIDVDSYQTPNFPATAIMENIRDRHSKTFSEGTDWFSFAIISFQMFCNIHPYRGKHPKLKTMDERMMANIPVFHKDVSYPKTCASFDIIPEDYKNWYKSVLYDGERIAPPTNIGQAVIIVTKDSIIRTTSNFDISEYFDYKDKVVKFISVNGKNVTITENNVFIENKKQEIKEKVYIGITPKYNRIISCQEKNGILKTYNIEEKSDISSNIACEEIMNYDGRIYIKNEDKILEVNFVELPNKTLTSASIVTNVLENATKMFDGVVIQNALGSCVVNIFPENKTSYQLILKEMVGYKIIEAKYDNHILMICANKNGKYDRFIFKINENYSSYELRKVEDIDYSGLNFIILDNGLVVCMNEKEELEIFSNKIGRDDIKVIDSKDVNGEMKLFKNGNKVLFASNEKLYNIKMKAS